MFVHVVSFLKIVIFFIYLSCIYKNSTQWFFFVLLYNVGIEECDWCSKVGANNSFLG